MTHLRIFVVDPYNSAVAKVYVDSDQKVSDLRAPGDLERAAQSKSAAKILGALSSILAIKVGSLIHFY